MHIQPNRSLKDVCTLGIGGPARYFVEVHTVQEAQEALVFAKENRLSFHVLGKGSNTLFDDRGFDGLIIANKIDFCSNINEGKLSVGAGYSFSLLGVQTARQGWSGLEFASGIPASVGGAVFMNAGANGKETSEVISSVLFLQDNGTTKTFSRDQLSFSYRSSPFQDLSGLIVEVTFSLMRDAEARSRQLKIIDYRKQTQPYSEKSAGCIFRNPGSQGAGALIDQTGLKGTNVGGAAVSEKHANFLINQGTATAADMRNLIALVRHQVKTRTGIELESEVRLVPYQKEPHS